MDEAAGGPAVAAAKAGAREQVLRQRRALGPEQRDRIASALVEAVRTLRPSRIAAYVSIGTEPSTRPLLAAFEEVLLPVLLPDGDLDWARYDGTLVPAAHGLVEPGGPRLGTAAVIGCDLVIVPALAVDRAGNRLGRGGGSYDRVLPRVTGCTLSPVYDAELVESLPRAPHDVAVRAVVTDREGLVLF